MRIRSATPDQLGERLGRLIARIEREQGSPPFGEILLAAMDGDEPDGFGVVAERDGAPEAYGYAVPGPDRRVWMIEMAASARLYDQLLGGMLERLERAGVAEAVLWVYSTAVAPPTGLLRPERSLYRMSTTLPIPDPAPPREGVMIKGMDVARDSSALIEVNNQAFGDHPEQGGWTPRDLETRLALEWFDPAGVRTAWIGGRMVAFNWTKIHLEPGPDGETVGEIYSIAVDPSFQGTGLGRAVAVEGLRFMAADRGAEQAILYVDSSNTPALKLYRSLGFRSDHVHRAYRWTAPPR